MSRLKKKKSPEVSPPVDETPSNVSEFPAQPSAHDEDFGKMNEQEKKVSDEMQIERDRAAALVRLNESTDYVLENFNLKNRGFIVSGFDDRINKVMVSLSNDLFDVKVTIKDPDSCGIFLNV